MIQVEDYAGKEARLRCSQQESQSIETHSAVNEHHRAGNDSPGNHDPRDPAPCAYPRQNQVARNLKYTVADKEDACPEAIYRGAEPKVMIHLQRCKCHVAAINRSDNVEQKQER